MLLTDDLVAVFAFFDTDELERLQIVCRPFLDLVDAHFKNQPLRQVCCYFASGFDAFKRSTEPGLTMYVMPKTIIVRCDEIEKWLRHAAVRNLTFQCTLDDRRIDMLLPFASKFRRATCRVPTWFGTLDSLVRAFHELLQCDTLLFQPFFVGGEMNEEVNYFDNAMFRLPCIQSCRSLHFRGLVSDRFPVNGLVDWLHRGDPKHFRARYKIRDSAYFVSAFKAALVEKFKKGTSPTAYKVILSFASRRVAEDISETLENGTTGESLTLAEDSSGVNGFTSDVRYTFTRRAAADEEEEDEGEAMDEYWGFREDEIFRLAASLKIRRV